MKIKTEFITNSSSSSFVVFGTTIDESFIHDDIIKKIQEKYPDKKIIKENIIGELSEYMDIILDGSKLDYSPGPYEDYDNAYMIGIPYTNMQDDETMAQFKERVKNDIFNIFKMDVTPYHIEECWMDN